LRAFKEGIEKTIRYKIISAVIFDRNYRSDTEVLEEKVDLEIGNLFVHIHSRKEIENFLLIPESINNAIKIRIKERNKRTGNNVTFDENINDLLIKLSDAFKYRIQSQLQSHRIKFEKSKNPKMDESTIIESILGEFDTLWQSLVDRLKLIHGKDFLASLNTYLQDTYKITVTNSNIINSIEKNQVPAEMWEIINKIEKFRVEPMKNNKA